jgi:hypothetical protein
MDRTNKKNTMVSQPGPTTTRLRKTAQYGRPQNGSVNFEQKPPFVKSDGQKSRKFEAFRRTSEDRPKGEMSKVEREQRSKRRWAVFHMLVLRGGPMNVVRLSAISILLVTIGASPSFAKVSISRPWSISHPSSISHPPSISHPWSISNPHGVSHPWSISNPHGISHPWSISNPWSISQPIKP